jgi:hypothetical protein
VNSIEDSARRLRQTGYQAESPVFEDLLQGIRGLFLRVPSLGDASRLELLDNLTGSKVLSSFLRDGWSLTAYHVGFMWERGRVGAGVSEFLRPDKVLKAMAFRKLNQIHEAVGIPGYAVQFWMNRSGMIYEVITPCDR